MVLEMVSQMVLELVLEMRMRIQMYMTCTMQLKYIIYNLPLRLNESIQEKERGQAKKQNNSARDAKVLVEYG